MKTRFFSHLILSLRFDIKWCWCAVPATTRESTFIFGQVLFKITILRMCECARDCMCVSPLFCCPFFPIIIITSAIIHFTFVIWITYIMYRAVDVYTQLTTTMRWTKLIHLCRPYSRCASKDSLSWFGFRVVVILCVSIWMGPCNGRGIEYTSRICAHAHTHTCIYTKYDRTYASRTILYHIDDEHHFFSLLFFPSTYWMRYTCKHSIDSVRRWRFIRVHIGQPLCMPCAVERASVWVCACTATAITHSQWQQTLSLLLFSSLGCRCPLNSISVAMMLLPLFGFAVRL